MTAISRAAVMCSVCSTDTTGSLPMPDVRIVTKAGTDSSPCWTMSSTALQQTVRASESVNWPIACVSVASERSSNLVSA